MRLPRSCALASAALLTSLALGAVPAAAQFIPEPEPGLEPPNASDAAAYTALSSAPVGAFAPLTDLGRSAGIRGGVQVTGQFGYIDEEGPISVRNFGLAFSMPVQAATLRLTGGISDFSCDFDEVFGSESGIQVDCNSALLAGLDATLPLVRPVLAGPGSGGFGAALTLSIGLSASDFLDMTIIDSFGGQPPFKASVTGTTYSAAVGAPLSFMARSGDVLVVPHLTPRLGYGMTTMKLSAPSFASDSDTDGGARFMLGAGVDILFGGSGFGVGMGAQKIFVDDTNLTLGINLSYRGR